MNVFINFFLLFVWKWYHLEQSFLFYFIFLLCWLKNHWWGSFGTCSLCCCDMYNLSCCRSSTIPCSCHFVQGKHTFSICSSYVNVMCIIHLQNILMHWDMEQDERCSKLKVYPILQKVLACSDNQHSYALATCTHAYTHTWQSCMCTAHFHQCHRFHFHFSFPNTLVSANRNLKQNLPGLFGENFEETWNWCICWRIKSTSGCWHIYFF